MTGRLTTSIREYPIPLGHQTRVEVTVSDGITEWCNHENVPQNGNIEGAKERLRLEAKSIRADWHPL